MQDKVAREMRMQNSDTKLSRVFLKEKKNEIEMLVCQEFSGLTI